MVDASVPTERRMVFNMLLPPAGRAKQGCCTCSPIACIVLLVSLLAITQAIKDGRIHFDLFSASVVEAPARPEDMLDFYALAAQSFIGGYTVSGHAIVQGGNAGAVELNSFTVMQECLCECTGTSTGIFCRGANDGNAFSLVAGYERFDGSWTAQQVSVGVKPSYQAIMRFGDMPGGPHSATGFFLSNNASEGRQTLFRAEQSAIGCDEGVGASACEGVCGRYGLPWAQIRERCGL